MNGCSILFSLQLAMPRGTPFSLLLNCAYARTAVYELFGKPPAAPKKKHKGDQQKGDNPGMSTQTYSSCNEGKKSGESQKKEVKDGSISMPQNIHKEQLVHFPNQQPVPEARQGQSSESITTTDDCSTLGSDQSSKGEDAIPKNETVKGHIKDPLHEFQQKFGSICNLAKSQFERNDEKYPSAFESSVKSVLTAFLSKWYPPEARKDYLDTFSLEKWQSMDKATQKSHSVSNCIACAVQHAQLQSSIPLKPVFIGKNDENVYGPFNKSQRENLPELISANSMPYV